MIKKYKYLFIIILVLGFLGFIFLFFQASKNKEKSKGQNSVSGAKEQSEFVENHLNAVQPVGVKQSPKTTAGNEQQEAKSKLEKIQELTKRDYKIAIDFWGKVVDQDGVPLAGVRAEITVDEYLGKKQYTTFSGENGLFELLGKKGARVRVKVFLDGYVPTSDEKIGSKISARTIYYSQKAMPAYAPPTKDNPQVFVLRKKNPIANLAHERKRRVSISSTGESTLIAMKPDGKSIEIEVRCWSSAPNPFNFDKYDWRAEIQIAGAMLQTITQLVPVTAPNSGYEQVFKFEMPKDTQKNWLRSSPNGKRDFWVQFDDGTYAKAVIEVKTGRAHEVDVDLWYNLDRTNNFEQ